MVKITKVYTRNGDQGMTQLAASHAIRKTHPRVVAYGTVDELNANLALAIASLNTQSALVTVQTALLRIQHELFDLGAQLAVLTQDRRSDTPVITTIAIERLEHEIDTMNDKLPMLTSFVLPGGCEAAARLHVARTVCRRAECQLVALAECHDETLDGTEIPYLNRLSDWLFVAARFVCHKLDIAEVLWSQDNR